MKHRVRILSILLALCLCAGCAAAEGILPVLQTPPPEETYAISLQSTTGSDYVGLDTADGGGYKYNYKNVTYACYTRFSQALAKEGYILVSSESLEDGVTRAVVTNGTVTLTLDYNMEKQTASVSYPPSVFARDPDLAEDYTEIKNGDEISLTDHATATVTGWRWSSSCYSRNKDKTFNSSTEKNYVFLCFDVDYFRPEDISASGMLRKPEVRYDGRLLESSYFTQGIQGSNEPNKISDYKTYFSGKMSTSFILAFTLTEDQLLHPDKVTVTFADYDNAVRYLYRLFATLPEDLTGTWRGKTTAEETGGESLDLTFEIWPDGSARFGFTYGEDQKTVRNAFSLPYPDGAGTFSVKLSTGTWTKAEGTWTLEAEGMSLKAKLSLSNDTEYGFTTLLKKSAE